MGKLKRLQDITKPRRLPRLARHRHCETDVSKGRRCRVVDSPCQTWPLRR
jgi:hypothetical protein